MIATKATRCARFCWAYVTRYPYISARALANAQGDYSYSEVVVALERLERDGFLRRENQSKEHGYYSWLAVIPFVVSAPAWAL